MRFEDPKNIGLDLLKAPFSHKQRIIIHKLEWDHKDQEKDGN